MATNPPNKGGTGPHTSKQGKSGPIIGSWTLGKGTGKMPKDSVAPKKVGASPSKAKSGGWYLGGKKKR